MLDVSKNNYTFFLLGKSEPYLTHIKIHLLAEPFSIWAEFYGQQIFLSWCVAVMDLLVISGL